MKLSTLILGDKNIKITLKVNGLTLCSNMPYPNFIASAYYNIYKYHQVNKHYRTDDPLELKDDFYNLVCEIKDRKDAIHW